MYVHISKSFFYMILVVYFLGPPPEICGGGPLSIFVTHSVLGGI